MSSIDHTRRAAEIDAEIKRLNKSSRKLNKISLLIVSVAACITVVNIAFLLFGN